MTSSVTIPAPGRAPPNNSDSSVRKKRTFDIAFLTGQSEKESESLESSQAVINNNNVEKVYRGKSPFKEETSDSSIDVMTNGSLSESEGHSPLSSISERATSPPLNPVIVHHAENKLRRTNGGGGISQNRNGHNSNLKRRNKPSGKEEIRFESRRTIDINHSQDSLKIKENLQFSTLLPSSSLGLNLSGPGMISQPQSSKTIYNDLALPHLASLLPHVTRFPLGLTPGVFPRQPQPQLNPFHAKLEKSESINISYPKRSGGREPFTDPYAAAALAAAGGYPYPNLFPSSFPNQGCAPQISPPQHSPPQTSPQSGSTLLPPSLTALTLPAQNVCAKCNIGFRMTSDLVYHMRSHHKRDADPVKRQREEKLKCPVCHETFRERHHLTRHMTAHQARPEEA